jgi:hypothetical protein
LGVSWWRDSKTPHKTFYKDSMSDLFYQKNSDKKKDVGSYGSFSVAGLRSAPEGFSITHRLDNGSLQKTDLFDVG